MLLERWVRGWARFVVRHPWAVLTACLLTGAVGAGLGTFRLPIQTDPDELVSSEADYYKRFKKEYLGNFSDTEYVYAVVETGGRPDRAIAFAERLAARVRALPGVRFARHGIDLTPFARAPLHLLPEADFVATRDRVRAAKDDLLRLGAATDLDDLLGVIVERVAGVALGGEESPGDREAFGFLDGLLADAEAALTGGEPTGEALRAFLPGARGGTTAHFFDTDPREDPDGARARFLFVAIQVDKDFTTLAVIQEPLERIREALAATQAEVPGVAAGLTGRPVLACDEMLSTQHDMNVANSLAFLGVFIIFCLAFRNVRGPVLVMACLALGLAWTLGFASLAVGSLNLLSIVFSVILIGLGGDFGIHVLARHVAERGAGATPEEAVERAVVATLPGNVTAGLTLAAAFLATQAVDFAGLAELGRIAGAGILLCLVAMVSALPAALLVVDRRFGVKEPVRPPLTFGWLGRLERRTAALALLAAGLSVVLWLPARRVTFDEGMLSLQDPRQESVVWERRLKESPSFSTWFAVFLAKDVAEARALEARCRARPDLFRRVEGPGDLLPPPGRDEAVRALARELGAAPPAAPARALGMTAAEASADLKALRDRLGELAGLLERLLALAAAQDPEAKGAIGGLRDRVLRVDGALAAAATRWAAGEAPAATPGWVALSAWQRALLDGLKGFVEGLLRPRPVGLKELPAEVAERFVGKDGRLAVYAYPRADLWEPAALRAFHDEAVKLDPQVTGAPDMVRRSVQAMRDGFGLSFLYAGLVVCALVALDLRRPRDVLLGLLPLALGLYWAAGLAGLIHLDLNLANFFAVPMLVGVGVDNGIHLVHAWREAPRENPAAGPTGTAVVMTSVTNLVGFGALAFADHRGLASLGLALAVGMTACLLSSLVVLPPLLVRLGRREVTPGSSPTG